MRFPIILQQCARVLQAPITVRGIIMTKSNTHERIVKMFSDEMNGENKNIYNRNICNTSVCTRVRYFSEDNTFMTVLLGPQKNHKLTIAFIFSAMSN